jgi:hypothetical protein
MAIGCAADPAMTAGAHVSWLRVGIINRNRETELKESEPKPKEPEPKKLIPYSVPNFEEPK